MQTRPVLTRKTIGTAKSFLDRAVYRAARDERIKHRNAMRTVLKRAERDESFRKELLFSGTEALEQYELLSQEKAALINGDIRFIEKKIGPLTPIQKCWPLHRLEAEIW